MGTIIILILVVNRFRFETNASKDHTKIIIEKRMCYRSVYYDLIGTIHHHGYSISSGHYTAKIYHNDVIYNCDDEKITIDYNHEKTSNSAYLIFYKPCGITSNDTHSWRCCFITIHPSISVWKGNITDRSTLVVQGPLGRKIRLSNFMLTFTKYIKKGVGVNWN